MMVSVNEIIGSGRRQSSGLPKAERLDISLGAEWGWPLIKA